MFGVDSSELIVVAVLALLFIGPKELPKAMMTVGRWVGRIRGYARHFTAGIENVIREAELEEMERKWREENDRIMREFPGTEAQAALTEAGATTEAAVDDPPSIDMPQAQTHSVAEQSADVDQSHLPPAKRELP